MKPHMLYASFRRCGSIYAWDLRNGSADGEPVCKYRFTASDSNGSSADGERKMTNQRLRFDVDIGGSWLGIGNQVCSFPAHRAYLFSPVVQNGDVSLFNLDHEIEVDTEVGGELDSVNERWPTSKFKAHGGMSI
jgi:hypothetical protein